jgi:hypothetical protein
VLPARIASPFEVVESQLALEILVVLFDGPPLMRQPDYLRERRGGRAARPSSVCGARPALSIIT